MRQSRGILLIGIVLGLLAGSVTVEPATRELVNTDSPQTLSNKTLVSPVLQGNVGIGTTSPQGMLQIGDVTTVSSAAQLIFGKAESSGASGLPLIQQKSVSSPGSSNDLAIGTVARFGQIYFYAGASNGEFFGANENAARMVITENGNVGIGTASPVSGSGSVALHIKGANPDLRLERSSTGRVWEIENNEYFYIYDRTAGVNRFSITTDGNVGIGTTTPSSRLDVSGGCITGSMCSDARLKEDIRPLPEKESYLEKVLRLRGVSFQWKGRPERGRQIGLVAQEVEQVLPEAVTTPEGDTAQKGLSCTALDAALVEALKEQQAQIRTLQQELAALRRGGV